MILDTDFLIDILRKKKKAINLLKELLSSERELYITHVNLWELYKGAYKSKNLDNSLSDIIRLINNFSVLEFSVDSAIAFGELDSKLNNIGTPIGVMDTLIASLAIVLNLKVITNNNIHFEKTGVELVNW